MPITVTLDPAHQDLDAIHRMLAATYWSPGIRRDVVAEALRNSITAVAIDDATGATVGLARVVTDRATFAWLCDALVEERFRGQGVARPEAAARGRRDERWPRVLRAAGPGRQPDPRRPARAEAEAMNLERATGFEPATFSLGS